MKDLSTLIPDIYELFTREHKVDPENIRTFSANVAEVVTQRLESIQKFDRPKIRVSKLGTKDRKLWYELNTPVADDEEAFTLSPDTVLKFMYGDLIEELVLLLVKEAGHKVEGEQGEIEVDGVIGHRDCIIDGVTVDVKSTSNFAFAKFSKGTLHQDDPFGYIAQISTYAYADKSPYGAFLAMNKETGQLTLLKIDPIDMIHPPTRIAQVREIESMPEPPPEKCYQPVPDGKTGNMVLNKNCNWCNFKDRCWTDANQGTGLRKFRYSNGIKNFTTVVSTPRVEEVT